MPSIDERVKRIPEFYSGSIKKGKTFQGKKWEYVNE